MKPLEQLKTKVDRVKRMWEVYAKNPPTSEEFGYVTAQDCIEARDEVIEETLKQIIKGKGYPIVWCRELLRMY